MLATIQPITFVADQRVVWWTKISAKYHDDRSTVTHGDGAVAASGNRLDCGINSR
jgi:hypothetical protein